jgi:alkylation response protein AidB-like acyl-CoA dehydrogenase
MLAEMAIKYESTRLLCHKAAWNIDQGQLDTVVSASPRPSAPTRR